MAQASRFGWNVAACLRVWTRLSAQTRLCSSLTNPLLHTCIPHGSRTRGACSLSLDRPLEHEVCQDTACLRHRFLLTFRACVCVCSRPGNREHHLLRRKRRHRRHGHCCGNIPRSSQYYPAYFQRVCDCGWCSLRCSCTVLPCDLVDPQPHRMLRVSGSHAQGKQVHTRGIGWFG
jgi:hypothetical protein